MIDYSGKFDLRTLIDLMDNIYDEIVIWDNNYTVLYVNNACYRHYGLRPEEIIGKTLDEFIVTEKYWSPSSLPYVYSEKKSIIQHQKTLLGIDVVTISVPILDEQNNVKYVIQSVRDEDDYLYKKLSPMEASADDKFHRNNYIIHRSDKMKRVIKFARKIAPVKVPCMILGETGTGKSLLARYIHEVSDRKAKPFISINMASINPTLIESEIFGYEKGAFTGANREGKKGLFELANGGTLFLDEIGEVPMDLQAKFLHVIQEEEFIPIGGITPIKLDVRIICATNCDLKHMVEVNKFREDLYHRLNVFEITIPPLREREEDLYTLISHFLNVFNKKYSKNCIFSEKSMSLLMAYPWKGNVRELSNVVERGILTAEENLILATDLPASFFKIDNLKSNCDSHLENLSLLEAIEEVKRKMITDAYKKYKTTRRVAEALSTSQSKACRLIKKYVNE
ncbi:sigma 54-interacting transcriptional regulator [Wukongibacter baidiensis]|uniref:sigma-54 interaction domain-containing protein n=1 Tax=Wukongibacter baidiensis TaxID=1723361 RepID=UPI003D7F88AC